MIDAVFRESCPQAVEFKMEGCASQDVRSQQPAGDKQHKTYYIMALFIQQKEKCWSGLWKKAKYAHWFNRLQNHLQQQ